MEKSEKSNKNKLGIILIGISLAGIVITVIFPLPIAPIIPLVYNPLQWIFCILLLIGARILTKSLIESKSESLYWVPTFFIGIITIVALFTPETYNRLVEDFQSIEELNWLWQFRILEQFQTTAVFYFTSILISAFIILFISIKLRKNYNSMADYARLLRITSNILAIFPLIFFFGKMFNNIFIFIIFFTPGFAIIGPFFMGFMIKHQIHFIPETLEPPLTEYQRKNNKYGHSLTIAGGIILLILGSYIDYFEGMLTPIMTVIQATFFVSYYQVVLLSIGSLVFILPFLSNSYPRLVTILLGILAILLLIHSLIITIITPILFTAIYLLLYIPGIFIAIDSNKTRKLLKSKMEITLH